MKKFLYTSVLILFLWFNSFLSPSLALTNNEPPTLDEFWVIIANAFEFFFNLIGIVAAAMFVYGAYMWIFSMGDPDKIKRARGTLTWAVVGIVFYAIMRLLLGFVLDLLGVDALPGVSVG